MKPSYLFLSLLPILAISAVSCGPKGPEKEPEPTVLTINPSSKTSESGFAHDIVFKVVCDGEFEASLAEGSWAKITERKEGNGDAINIIVHLEDNMTEQNRSETLTVTAGSLKQEAKITQLTLGIVFPEGKLEFASTAPVVQKWKLPSVWSVKCCNADGTAADWFSVSPMTGLADTETEVSIAAKVLNLSESSRSGYLEVNLGVITLKTEIELKPVEYGNDSFGIFNYDGADASIAYEPLKDQYSRIKGTNGAFRLISPASGNFLIVKGLPTEMNVGDNVSLDIYQSYTDALPYNSQYTASVFKTSAEKVWMVAGGTICFVVPK